MTDEDTDDSVSRIDFPDLGSNQAPPAAPVPESLTSLVVPGPLLEDVRRLIASARARAALYVNQELTLLYWDVGGRVRRDILGEERAEYGQRVVRELAAVLTREFGVGFDRANLARMLQFATLFPDRDIVATLSRELGWSHFKEILPLHEPLKRAFYTELARVHRWSVRTLRDKIRGMLFERSALSRQPDDLIAQEIALLRDDDRLTPDMVLRDPYLLPFLGLSDTYSEKDLEDAILREMEAFLLEIGDGFAFVARQKQIPIRSAGGKVRALDLLFYHRKLRRLVAIELKVGPFEPEHKGQMEFYLRWLDENEKEPGEDAPIGLILCSEAHPDDITLLGLDQGDIRVARYITETLPPPLLENKLREIIRQQREYLARRQISERIGDSGEADDRQGE
jgi:predicted nuclease of restriction endonuclease-like (RecB) superfamily